MRVGAALLALVAVSGCGGSGVTTKHEPPPHTATTPTVATVAPARTTTVTPTVTQPKPRPRPKRDPGTLPQTEQLPSSDTRVFHAEMAALWAGVQRNSVARAMPAFFPERAYAQVKTIGDPQGDYTGRLVADYQLDLAAAHGLLGPDPRSAGLVAVHVAQAYAHWVEPGACYNRVGYYEVPNARLVYRQGGQIHSFGIASMISWRGVWYVIHLGAILRPSAGGMVDAPGLGVGSSAPSSTC